MVYKIFQKSFITYKQFFDSIFSTGDLCSNKWAELKRRFEKAMKQYKEIPSGDGFPIDLDWLVITEMQFLNDHVENRPVLSTMDISGSSNLEALNNSDYNMKRLRDEQDRFTGTPLSNKKRSIWSAPWQEKEKIRQFQDVLPEKVPEFDEFAKSKFAKRNDIIATVQKYGKKLENFSHLVLEQENQRGMYGEILESVMRQMSPNAK